MIDRMEFTIDCSDCEQRVDSAHCDDCVVAYILDRPAGAIVFDAAEERALRALSGAGMLPRARLKRRVS